MPYALMIVAALHVLPAVFWAGSTLVLARTGAAVAEQVAVPQIGAAAGAVIFGAVLWRMAYGASFGPSEQTLAVGAAAALAALLIQVLALPAVRRLDAASDGGPRRRVALSQQVAAGLLVLAIICMSIARYV